MKNETSVSRRLLLWNNLPAFHTLSLIATTAVWWLFMRLDDQFVGLILNSETGNILFILVSAGMLHIYFQTTAQSRSRAGRIITALLCPFIGFSALPLLIAPIALIADPSGPSAAIAFFAIFIAPLCLIASWKAMLVPMILTCCLAEHIANLGARSRLAERKKLRKTLQSPAGLYLFTKSGRIPDMRFPH